VGNLGAGKTTLCCRVACADGRNNWVFQAVGISDTDLSTAESRLLEWLAQGLHGELDYMAKTWIERSRPAQLIPGTLRVISLRMNYLPPAARDSWQVLEETERAYISRYALDVTITSMRQRWRIGGEDTFRGCRI